jgi:hypothetical protein
MNVDMAGLLYEPLEAVHMLVYLDPELREEYKEAGLRGAWMGYFASRAAALGPVSAEVVQAAFYGFRGDLVRRAIPDAWSFAPPERVLVARHRGIDRALRRRLGEAATSADLVEAASLARVAMEGCDASGRVLFGAHSALDWPEEPHLVFWHAATLFREFRGDGHVAALLTAEIGPCQSVVLHAATGGPPREWLQANRGWSDAEWETATDSLGARGWFAADGSLTDDGRAARVAVEDVTNQLSVVPWRALGEDRSVRLLELAKRVRVAAGA